MLAIHRSHAAAFGRFIAKPASLAVLLSMSAPMLLREAAGQPLAQQAGSDRAIEVAGGVRGTIESVTVYRGEALVARSVPLALSTSVGDGVRELVVTDLPEQIRPESLHGDGPEGVMIRSVRYRTRPITVDNRAEVRAIDDRLRDLADRGAANSRRIELIGEHRAYLTSLQQFVAPTASAELTQGVLNAQTLQEMTTFVREQRAALAQEELALAKETREIGEQVSLAQRERELLAGVSSRMVREAVVLIAGDPKNGAEGADAGAIRLRYLVGGAGWSPSYTARRERGNAAGIALEYYAAVTQLSGEDWEGVTMTLSTATPSLTARGPKLEPMRLALSSGAPEANEVAGRGDAYRELKRTQAEVGKLRASGRNEFVPGAPQMDAAAAQQRDGESRKAEMTTFADQFLNRNAVQMQLMELNDLGRFSRVEVAAMRASEEGLSVMYAIEGTASLPSRDDRQLVRIATLPLSAEFAKVATPVLTEFIYDEASVTNTSSMVLLASPVTAYSDGAFVGGGDIPTIASGERFMVGFGNDSSLRATKELVERRSTMQGGNRVVELTYRLTIENFGDREVPIRLMDRIPKAVDGQVKLTLAQSTPPVSTDNEYVRSLKKDGIMRWDVKVPANAANDTALVLEYGFTLEFDRQMNLSGLGG